MTGLNDPAAARHDLLQRFRPHFLILRRHQVGLWCYDGEGQRFARLFRQAWRRLPLGPRRRILRHWKAPAAELGLRFSPVVTLVSGFTQGQENVLASVGHRGHVLRFRSAYIDQIPDGVVVDLVAHELAHCFQFSQGAVCSADELESDADDLMVRWGFVPGSVDEWAISVGLLNIEREFHRPARGQTTEGGVNGQT